MYYRDASSKTELKELLFNCICHHFLNIPLFFAVRFLKDPSRHYGGSLGEEERGPAVENSLIVGWRVRKLHFKGVPGGSGIERMSSLIPELTVG
ncbi:hypothetical protein AVEN_85026-1 [Araneus ventricosus]|uniref:Uncharacterized protein n=1 Tax=Araneus ventricosus TaxID=182803 RepID=A0A4Y2P2S6_ARAVE|nr:hypothetical protein AVEN_85026-1 [Araneus ventricosus]